MFEAYSSITTETRSVDFSQFVHTIQACAKLIVISLDSSSFSENGSSPMVKVFQSPRAKVRRAEAHIRTLPGMAETFTKLDHGEIKVEVYDPDYIHPNQRDPKDETTWFSSSAVVQLSLPMADDIATIIGDILHNLRSALDVLACDLVALNGRGTSDVYFPFCSSSDEIKAMIVRRNMDRARADVVALIETLQIYPEQTLNLRTIHDLNVLDKHRSMISGMCMSSQQPFKVSGCSIKTDFRPIFHQLGKGLDFLNGQEAILVVEVLTKEVKSTVEAFAALYNI